MDLPNLNAALENRLSAAAQHAAARLALASAAAEALQLTALSWQARGANGLQISATVQNSASIPLGYSLTLVVRDAADRLLKTFTFESPQAAPVGTSTVQWVARLRQAPAAEWHLRTVPAAAFKVSPQFILQETSPAQ